MSHTRWKPRRREFLQGSAALAGSMLVLPGKAPAQGGAKKLSGTTLNVSCWSAPYPKMLAEYIPEFEQMTGAKVNYDTPSFPVYNQRIDLELSTQGSSYDVLNITFIYAGRWIGAGWFTPLDDLIKDQAKTPAAFDAADFLGGLTTAFKDKSGKLYGIPWTGDVFMSGASRYDLFEKVGVKMPDTFEELAKTAKAVHKQDGVPGYLCENHYGWSWIPWLQGYGGNIFRNPPDDLMPTLDSPEAVQSAEIFGDVLRNYGPDGALSYGYEQVAQALKAGRVNLGNMSHAFLSQMGQSDSKVIKTCNFAICPSGPKGRFPGVATHGWGIPIGSKQKDAAWTFITWAMSKELVLRLVKERNYGGISRRSIVNDPLFREKLTINGHDVGKVYVESIDAAGTGYMKYRTQQVFPQVAKQIDIAISNVISKQMSAKEALKKAQEDSIVEIKRAGINL